MKKSLAVLAAAAGVFVALGANATVGEKVDTAIEAVEHGVKAGASGVERGVKAGVRGAKKAASGVERGVKAAASGVERGASWAATGVEKGVDAAKSGASAAATKLGIGESKPHEPAPVETAVPKPVKRGK